MERRLHKRTGISIDCCLFDLTSQREYSGRITDISESGIGIKLNGTDLPASHNDFIIQFASNLDWCKKDYLIQESIELMRISQTDDNVVVGAKFLKSQSKNVIEYVHNVEAQEFINLMKKSQ